MLQALTLPATLSRVLGPLRSYFTTPTFEVFTALVAGLVAQPVSRTVCSMLTGRVWPASGITVGRTGSSPWRGGAHESSGWG